MVNNIFNYLPEKKIISNFLKETNRQQHYQIKLQIYTKVHRTVRTSHGHCVVLHSSQLLITRLETRHHLTTIYYIYIYITLALLEIERERSKMESSQSLPFSLFDSFF